MSENKKAASGAGNTTDSRTEQSTASVAQQGSEVKPYTQGQRTAIRMAYRASEKKARELNDPKILSERVETLVKQFAPYEFTREQIVAIGSGSFGNDNDPDFGRPAEKPPMMMDRRKAPVKWTDAMVRTLQNMLADDRRPAEIAQLMNLERTQVVTKINSLKKQAALNKLEPASAPAPTPAEPEKPVPAFDLTAVKQPISENLDIFSTLQDIMRQAGAGYASVSITRQDGTKYRAEVRK